MQINTVKKTMFGFIVNNEFHVPNDPNNSDYQKIQKWIAEGGEVIS